MIKLEDKRMTKDWRMVKTKCMTKRHVKKGDIGIDHF